MTKENISQEFRVKNIDETKNHFTEKMNKNDLMSKNHKEASKTLHYIEHFLILTSTVTGCVSISDFASLLSYETNP